jgi:hypothetical protein
MANEIDEKRREFLEASALVSGVAEVHDGCPVRRRLRRGVKELPR